MSAAVLTDAASTLGNVATERDAAECLVAELLEAIGLATGISLSTAPTSESVAEAKRVLVSLTSPVDDPDGWYWADATEGERSGPFATEDALTRDVASHADQLPRGHLVALVHDGKLLAPMYVPPKEVH
jgi:hypothetical protein